MSRLLLFSLLAAPVLFLVSLLAYKAITGNAPGPLQQLTAGIRLSLKAPEFAQEGALIPLSLEVHNGGPSSVLVRSARPVNTLNRVERWLQFPGTPLAGGTALPTGGYLRSALVKPGATQQLTVLYRPMSENSSSVTLEVSLSRETHPKAFQLDPSGEKAVAPPGSLGPLFTLSAAASLNISPATMPFREFQTRRLHKLACTYSSWLQAWVEQTPSGIRALWPQNVEEVFNGLDFYVIDFIDVSASDIQLISVISRLPLKEDLLKRLSERFNPTPYLGTQEIAAEMRFRVRLSNLRYCFRELLAAGYKISVEKHDGVAIITARD